MPDSGSPNEGQRVFWAEGPGMNWVRLHEELDRLHHRLNDFVLDAAAPAPGERVLDIGCGGGALSLAAMERVGPSGHVLGLDISEPLLGVARERAAKLSPGPDFACADAQTWTTDQSFDVVISRMGVMFFADPYEAFRNIRKMLNPSGRLAFICWRQLEENPWFAFPLAAAIACTGPAEASDPHAPGPMAFCNPARVTGILEEAGFTSVAAHVVDTTLHVPGGAEAAATLSTEIGPAMRHLRDTGGTEEDKLTMREDILQRFLPFEKDGICDVPAKFNLLTAVAP